MAAVSGVQRSVIPPLGEKINKKKVLKMKF